MQDRIAEHHADSRLYHELQKPPIEVIAITGAVKARKIINAVYDMDNIVLPLDRGVLAWLVNHRGC